MQILYKTVL